MAINLSRDSKAGIQQFLSSNHVSMAIIQPRRGTGEAKAEEQIALVGAGVGNISIRQAFNTEPVFSIGWGDIVEHVTHNVRSNQLTIQKQTLVHAMLKNSIAQLGMDNLTAPTFDAILYNSFWSSASVQATSANGGGGIGVSTTPGTGLQLIYCQGMHLTDNAISINVGQTVNEAVTFMVDKFFAFKPGDKAAMDWAKALYVAAQKVAGKEGIYKSDILGNRQEFTTNQLNLGT